MYVGRRQWYCIEAKIKHILHVFIGTIGIQYNIVNTFSPNIIDLYIYIYHYTMESTQPIKSVLVIAPIPLHSTTALYHCTVAVHSTTAL